MIRKWNITDREVAKMVEPMYLSEVEKPEDCKFLKNGIVQNKEDGVRAILHIKDGRVLGIRDKHNKPISMLFPELNAITLPAIKSGIIDGEVCVILDGKSVYNGGIDQRRSIPSALKMAAYPVTFIAFDLLHLNGTTLLNKPYRQRWDSLKSVILESDRIKLCEVYPDFDTAWKKVIEFDLEGVVVKYGEAPYIPGKRVDTQVKIKYRKDEDVGFTSYEINPVGITLLGPEGTGLRVACNGEKHVRVKKLLDEKGIVLATISYQGKTLDGKYRMPTFKRLTEE